MIEIKKRNAIWEVYVDGGLFYYNSDLKEVFEYLARNIENVMDGFYE